MLFQGVRNCKHVFLGNSFCNIAGRSPRRSIDVFLECGENSLWILSDFANVGIDDGVGHERVTNVNEAEHGVLSPYHFIGRKVDKMALLKVAHHSSVGIDAKNAPGDFEFHVRIALPANELEIGRREVFFACQKEQSRASERSAGGSDPDKVAKVLRAKRSL